MPIRKKGDVEIKTSPKGAQVKQTGYTFYSYDKNSAALYFNFREENGEPTDLANATIRLVFVLNDEKITPKTDDIEIWLAVPGTARYIIPESMLGREGKVTGYVYLEFSDGSHTDEGRFTFEIKQSMITDMLPEAGEQYVKDFEDIKAEVQSTADKATSDIKSRVDAVENAKNSTVGDIEKAKDNAEIQIGDYVGEIESAKQDIDSSVSDVHSKASEASEDISGIVKTTEDARDEAKSQIGDYVGEVEKDYKEWKEKQEDKQSKFEDDTNERVNKITERVGEAENKASDLESNLDVAQKNYFSIRDWQKRPDFTVTGNRMPAMKIQVKKNQKYTLSSNIEPRTDGAANIFLTYGYRDTVNSSANGVYPDQPKTITAQDDGEVIVAIRDIDITKTDLWIMLNKGEYAVKWTPNTNDIVTVKQYKKLEQAVINLGGSI